MILGVFLLSSLVSSATVMKKSVEATETMCEDNCQTCQRVVYQMKFQGTADCDSSGPCRGTCEKIRETWGQAFNPFEPFLKDVFGKCEICFRAGHCTISQCKDQERNEEEIIKHVINSSHLTAKVNPDLLVSFPDQPDEKGLAHTIKVNAKVEKTLKKEIKTAVSLGSAEYLIPKVQNLVKNYFDQPSVVHNGSANTVLSAQPIPVSTASISFWSEVAKKGVTDVNKAQKAFEKLTKHIEKVGQLKSSAKTDEKKSASKVIKKEKKELSKLINKTKKIDNQLKKRESAISKLIVNPEVMAHPEKLAVLNDSLGRIQQYKSAVNTINTQLNKDKRQLAKRH